MGGGEAGDAQGEAIAVEDFGETLPNHGAYPPAHQGLGSVLAAGAAAEIAVHQQQARPLVVRLIEGMGSLELDPVVGKHLLAKAFKGDALEEAGRDDPVGVDVIAAQHQGAAFDLGDRPSGQGGRRGSAGHGELGNRMGWEGGRRAA